MLCWINACICIIQAEGSNSSLLSEVETLRKRVLKIEGKDEEIRKAEDLCRSVRERLEEDERVTKGLKVEVERLQVKKKYILELNKMQYHKQHIKKHLSVKFKNDISCDICLL